MASSQIRLSDWTPVLSEAKLINGKDLTLFSLYNSHVYNKLSSSDDVSVWLPSPDGLLINYTVSPTQTVHPSVAHHYSIKTYRGHKTDDPTIKISCDFTPDRLSAAILDAESSYVIESDREVQDQYRVYYNKDLSSEGAISCSVKHSEKEMGIANKLSTQTQKKTYRLGLVSAGEYSQYAGGAPVNATTVLNAMLRPVIVSLFDFRQVSLKPVE